MTIPPIITVLQLPDLGPLRLLYVPTSDERPDSLTVVPIREWIATAKQSETGFDDTAYWQDQIARLGLGRDALTVVLDDGGMTEAARVWFILQYFGLPAAVLNGGYPELTDIPQQALAASKAPQLSPGSGPVGLMDRHHLNRDLGSVQIFDARTQEEFDGDDLKGNARGGHLPGAHLLDHRDLLTGRYLKSASDLAQLMSGAGFDRAQPVVSHCNGGGRAALAALAALVAGQSDVRVYYLSFSDWAADESCPLAAGK